MSSSAHVVAKRYGIKSRIIQMFPLKPTGCYFHTYTYKEASKLIWFEIAVKY